MDERHEDQDRSEPRTSSNGDLVIDYSPSGRNGTATITAKLGADVLAVERLHLTDPRARERFARGICDGRPGIEAEALEAELLRLAAELANRPQVEALADLGTLPELDTSRIIRPERFLVREVSGLAVPMTAALGQRAIGRWQLYLRWADGRRECRPLRPTVELPDGSTLWIHPEPSEPTPTTRPGWSREARRRWLAGEAVPDAIEVFGRVSEKIAYFLDLPKTEAPGIVATLALWTMMSYSYCAWPAVPYLYIGGPLGSGKSRVFEVLSRLVFRPLGSSSLTAAALFRTLHSHGGTLLLDEAERLRDVKDPGVSEVRSILLAGYKRGGQATRLEPTGDTFKTVTFDVYGPKALACIAGLPPALASRAIPIYMFRAPPDSIKPKRRIDADPDSWQRLRDDLHALALEHGATWLELSERDGVCPAGIDGRHYELWQPLLAIASWLDELGAEGLLGLMQNYALKTIELGRDDQMPDAEEVLLRILAEKLAGMETPQPKEILEAAQAAEPTVFRQWSPKGVSNALRRYGIHTMTLHGRKVYRTSLTDLARIQATYGLTLGVSTENQSAERPEG